MDSDRLDHTTYHFSTWGTRIPRDGFLRLLQVGRDLGLVPPEFVLRHAPRLERDHRKYLSGGEATIEMCVPTYDVPSETSGHSHIYVEHEMSWQTYKRLLDALQAATIIRGRFHEFAMRRKQTLLLTPWRTKQEMCRRLRLGANNYGSGHECEFCPVGDTGAAAEVAS